MMQRDHKERQFRARRNDTWRPAKLFLALSTFVLMHGGPAHAQAWVEIATDDATVHFVDESSMKREGEVVRVTKRAVYREPQPIGELPGTPLIRESVGVVEDDCTRLQHRVISIQLISVDDKVIWSSGDMRRVWESIDPGSPGRATLDWVCARTASK